MSLSDQNNFFILFSDCIKNQLSLKNKTDALIQKFIIEWQYSLTSARFIFTLDSLKLLFENIFYIYRFRPCFRMMKWKRWRRREFFNIFFCINNFSRQFFRFRWFSMAEKWARSRECWGRLTKIFLYHTLLRLVLLYFQHILFYTLWNFKNSITPLTF